MKLPFLLGRVIFGGFFVASGIKHFQQHRETAEYAGSKGVPQPDLAVTLSAIPLLAGGTSLVLGVKPKLGALAILGFLVGVSPIMHDFWNMDDPKQQSENRVNFLKNMALAGAALALLQVKEPWEASLPTTKSEARRALRQIRRQIAA